ncbi:MAG: ATP-binding cassette domain-containing protein, partial [Muribaculaceae bacterium]|nr:ATP-binding cassette domain-containing protein [Muribaculaceae bacterium]
EMRAALHDAAADFVFDLKYGLETTCGEHGDGLSEGQAQRIAIARGLLLPGSIMLLDEISASLDEETENELLSRLSSRRGSHTIIFVTHRTAVLTYCDKTLHLS